MWKKPQLNGLIIAESNQIGKIQLDLNSIYSYVIRENQVRMPLD
jgi:hypothetical protein